MTTIRISRIRGWSRTVLTPRAVILDVRRLSGARVLMIGCPAATWTTWSAPTPLEEIAVPAESPLDVIVTSAGTGEPLGVHWRVGPDVITGEHQISVTDRIPHDDPDGWSADPVARFVVGPP